MDLEVLNDFLQLFFLPKMIVSTLAIKSQARGGQMLFELELRAGMRKIGGGKDQS